MISALLAERAEDMPRPPLVLIHSIWLTARWMVARAGVLYVWSLSELSLAILRSIDAGIQRSPVAMRSMRSMAAGDTAAIHRPPSEARHFCGAK